MGHLFWGFFFCSNKNPFLLLSYYFSTHSSPQLRCLSYCGYFLLIAVLSTAVSQYFYLTAIFQFVGIHNMLLQRRHLRSATHFHGRIALPVGQDCRTYGTRKDFLGTWHSLLPHFFFYSFCPTSVAILWRICAYIHISECVDTVYELPLLPSNTASGTYLHNSGAVRSVHWIFIIGAPA